VDNWLIIVCFGRICWVKAVFCAILMYIMPKKLTKQEYNQKLLALYAKYDQEFAKLEKETRAIQKKAQIILDRLEAKKVLKNISTLK
jgi:hypothetical protein